MDEKHRVREINLAVCEEGQLSDRYSYPHFCAIFLKQYLAGTLGYRCIVRLNIRQRNKNIDCVTTIPRYLGNQTMSDTPQPHLVKFYPHSWHVSWWRHQMETFSALLALCAGNSPVPVISPHKGQWRGALMLSLICARINDWVNYHEAGDLRRHRGHYDISVMIDQGDTESSSFRLQWQRHLEYLLYSWNKAFFISFLKHRCRMMHISVSKLDQYLVQIMACRLSDTEPLPEPLMLWVFHSKKNTRYFVYILVRFRESSTYAGWSNN